MEGGGGAKDNARIGVVKMYTLVIFWCAVHLER
jgi:hypothetical protein